MRNYDCEFKREQAASPSVADCGALGNSDEISKHSPDATSFLANGCRVPHIPEGSHRGVYTYPGETGSPGNEKRHVRPNRAWARFTYTACY